MYDNESELVSDSQQLLDSQGYSQNFLSELNLFIGFDNNQYGCKKTQTVP